MPVGSAEPEGRHRRSAARRTAPIEEFRWDRSSEAGQIDVVVQPGRISKLVVLTPYKIIGFYGDLTRKMVILWWFNSDLMGFTLWLCQQFAIENGHRNSEFSH